MNNNISKKNILEETHSNLMLLSTVVSMVLLTFVFFVYTKLFGQANKIMTIYNALLVISFSSWVISLVLGIIAMAKNKFFTEYSLILSALSVCFFAMRGVMFISAKNAAIATIGLIVLYWVLSFIYHSFWHKFDFKPKYVNTVIIIFLIISVAVVLFLIYKASKMPFFNLWYTNNLY